MELMLTITELAVCDKLEEFRRQGEGYLGQSFAPIAAYGAHGAIVHYEPDEKSNIPLDNKSFLLLDSWLPVPMEADLMLSLRTSR